MMESIRHYALIGIALVSLTSGVVWHLADQLENSRSEAAEQAAREERRTQISTTSTSLPTVSTAKVPTSSQPNTTMDRSISSTPSSTTTTTSSTTTTTLPGPPDRTGIDVNGEPFAEVRIDRLSSRWLDQTGYQTETLVRGDETELPDPLETALEGGLAWQGSSYSNWYDNGDNVVESDELVPANDLGLPGEGKTVFIAAHRGGSERNKAFGYLDEMQIGDEVVIATNWGMEYTYHVTEAVKTVHKSVLHEEAPRLDELEGEHILLYACEPGTSDRLFVVGELVSAVSV